MSGGLEILQQYLLIIIDIVRPKSNLNSVSASFIKSKTVIDISLDREVLKVVNLLAYWYHFETIKSKKSIKFLKGRNFYLLKDPIPHISAGISLVSGEYWRWLWYWQSSFLPTSPLSSLSPGSWCWVATGNFACNATEGVGLHQPPLLAGRNTEKYSWGFT